MNRKHSRVSALTSAFVVGVGLVGLSFGTRANVAQAQDGAFPGLHGGAGTEISSMNLNDTKTQVDFRYHGPAAGKPHLEARVMQEDAKTVKVGLSLWEKDVAFSTYDAKRNTLEVYMTPAHLKDPEEVRIAILKMTPFDAPAGVKTVRVVYLP